MHEIICPDFRPPGRINHRSENKKSSDNTVNAFWDLPFVASLVQIQRSLPAAALRREEHDDSASVEEISA
jgi:hypothetical protein